MRVIRFVLGMVIFFSPGLFSQEKNVPLEENLEEILQSTTATSYSYDPKGRRDPFRSLLAPGNIEKTKECEGIGCLRIDEIKLNGIIRVKGEYYALIQGEDEKPYWVKAGDAFLDGEVSRVTQDAVFFKQKVNDPTRIHPYREVVRSINPEEKP